MVKSNKKSRSDFTGSYAARILSLLSQRGVSKTACPSEVLPAHLKQSPPTMEKVRAAARALQKAGKIEILRGGKVAEPGSSGPIRLRLKRPSQKFDYTLDFKKIDFRKHPDLYRVGKGEQGVLLVEPYKSEILPYWKFKSPEIANTSAKKIYALFLQYERKKDFIGMDMARKFIQMGVTRARRYANHRSGKKYIGPVPKNKKGQSGAHGRKIAKSEPDPVKAECAEIFRAFLDKVNTRRSYRRWLEIQTKR